jgi:hypothetical protein
MNSYRNNARITGILFIIAIVAPLVSFPFSQYINDPDYLITVSENSSMVIVGGLLEMIMAFAVIGIAVCMYPVLRKYNESLALGAVSFRVIEGILGMFAVISMLSLITLSQEYLAAGAMNDSPFVPLGTLVLSFRHWAGILGPIAFILAALMYYYIFFKSTLVPRWLSVWGLIGVPLWLTGELLILFGVTDSFSTMVVVLDLPIALNELALAVWLIAKGFNPSAIESLSSYSHVK